MHFRKKYIEKYDLQESYNNFKIKLKIFLCESGPRSLRDSFISKIIGSILNSNRFILELF